MQWSSPLRRTLTSRDHLGSGLSVSNQGTRHAGLYSHIFRVGAVMATGNPNPTGSQITASKPQTLSKYCKETRDRSTWSRLMLGL